MRTLAFMPGGMPGIGEIGIIALILVLLFGASKLPQLARALGSSLTEFKKGRREGERKDDKLSPHETAKEPEKGNDSPHAKS